jgi:hypothetical protein
MLRMSVVVTLEVSGRVVTLAGPAGGEFNAAGDFDRLLSLLTHPPVAFASDFPMLGRVDEYGETRFGSAELAALAGEAMALLRHAKDERERRAIDRLIVLARHGQYEPAAVMRAIGD